jgi:8-hydroxy-5-deazaflavin:NADPH oxidoreductase
MPASRIPEAWKAVRAFADEIGVTAVDTREVVRGADVIVISIPFPAVAELPKDLFDTVPQDIPGRRHR